MSSQSTISFPVGTDIDAPGRPWKAQNLDAALLLLPAGHIGVIHTSIGRGVVLAIVAGSGTLVRQRGPQVLRAGVVLWLRPGRVRGVLAGSHGLAYVTVRR